jgi:hypothetical protein
MLSLLESDYPRDIIERQINDRLQKRLFKMWWNREISTDVLRLFRWVNIFPGPHLEAVMKATGFKV